MLRVSRITDYGIVLLCRLAVAHDDDQVHNARELAELTELPPPMVSKILKVLTRTGFLASQRGSKGGYALARAPEEVSMAEVIDALEGPIALTECGLAGACDREDHCAVQAPLQRINRAIRRTLEQFHLADLVDPPAMDRARVADRAAPPPAH